MKRFGMDDYGKGKPAAFSRLPVSIWSEMKIRSTELFGKADIADVFYFAIDLNSFFEFQEAGMVFERERFLFAQLQCRSGGVFEIPGMMMIAEFDLDFSRNNFGSYTALLSGSTL